MPPYTVVMRQLAVALTLALACLGLTQGDFMGLQRSMMTAPSNLLQTPDFRNDLKLDKEQSKTVNDILKEHRKRTDEISKTMQGGNAAGLGGFRALQEMNAETDKRILALLSSEQSARLRQLQWQCLGYRALYEEDLQKKVGITEEQLAKLHDFQAGESGRMLEAMRGGGAGAASGIKKVRQESEKTVLGLLTAEQLISLKAALGKELKAAKRMSESMV